MSSRPRKPTIGRHTVLVILCATASAFCLGNTPARGQDAKKKNKSVFNAVELNHLSLNIEKIERAENFYRTVFGMTPVDHGRRGRDRFLHFREGFLNMRPSGEASINHYCMSIDDYETNSVYQMSALIETDPFLMGRSVHCFDPDRFNVQIEEARHGWGRIRGNQLTDAKTGVFQTVRIHHLSLNVKDLKESTSFYREVFGGSVVSTNDKRVLLKVGPAAWLELAQADSAGINHYCFAVADFDQKTATEKLKDHVDGEITVPEDGVLRFNDPNGIPMEITSPDHQMH